MELEGAFTALITPFDKNMNLDEEGYRKHIRHQIEGGIDGIVPMGTTGECATMSHEEHRRAVEIAIDEAGGEVPVIAGTGSNNTKEALELTRHAKNAGADGVLLVSPYYNKPTQRGLYNHYKKIAKEVDIPQIVYNVPSRTGKNIDPETIGKLSKLKNIAGVKEASGNVKQAMEIKNKSDPELRILSGDDHITLPILASGGHGAISVASNIVPRKVSEMIHSYLNGKTEKAQKIHYELQPLFQSLFIETNPGPAKAAMNILDRPAGKPRLPLVEAEKKTKKVLRNVLEDLELL